MAKALRGAVSLAPAREVAAWVAEQCGTEISALRDKVERDAMPAPAALATHASPPRRFARPALLVAALLLCGGIVAIALRTSPVQPEDRGPPSASLDVTGLDALKPSSPAMIAASSSPVPAEDSPAPSTSSKSEAASKSRPARGGAKKPCASPYSIDPDGVRRIRRECL